jgi:GAF domain-containing protein
LVLVGPRGLQVMASSTERMRVTELLEVQLEEGPCFDCYRTGLPVLNQQLVSVDRRWPRFAPRARESGFKMVHAVPLRLRDEVIGAMNVFDTLLQELTQTDSNLLRAFADTATIGILQERMLRQQSHLSVELQSALNSRIAVEQAKGILAERLQVDMDTAFGMIRHYARSHSTYLSSVADALVRGSLSAADLSASSKGRVSDSPRGMSDEPR